MIAISTHQKQIELRLKFSFAWLETGITMLIELFNFHEIREIERRKQKELHEAGLGR